MFVLSINLKIELETFLGFCVEIPVYTRVVRKVCRQVRLCADYLHDTNETY